MNRKAQAIRLARIELVNDVVPEEDRRQVLAEAQAAGVTISDYIRAHSILKISGEARIEMETDEKTDDR